MLAARGNSTCRKIFQQDSEGNGSKPVEKISKESPKISESSKF